MARHDKITQNSKFAISLQYREKLVRSEVDFLPADKDKVSYKLILWFSWGWSSITKVPKIASLQCLYNISEKKLEVISCMQINIKVWASKFPVRWYYQNWWAWSSILKVLKVTNLQYLYNIAKQKFLQVGIGLVDGSGQTCQNCQK